MKRSAEDLPAASADTISKAIRNYVEASRVPGPDNSWQGRPEIPTADEILATEDDSNDIEIPANLIRGPWPSSEVYLKAHYELLREDAVAPLRDAVAYVHIVGLTYAHSSVAVRVSFSTARAKKNIVWEYSKRLTTGTIVALTPSDDAFASKCVIAVVAARPLTGVKAEVPEIDLFFARAEEAEFDYQQEWLMVESRSGYYEASRHSLTALQKLSRESFPLSDYLCNLKAVVDTPKYIQGSPIMDMSSILGDERRYDLVDVLKGWPSAAPNVFDPSQWQALNQILTKELAIVQGPPGTGKTHVSIAALKALLANMKPGDPPIIIAAQTNHALDQLLRHVSQFEMQYVRLGGRSEDADIKKRTLFELKRKQNVPSIPGNLVGASIRKMRGLVEKISTLMAPFTVEKSHSPLPVSLFLDLGLISQAQHDSLLKGAEGWIHSGNQVDPMSTWLGQDRIAFKITYKTQNFGFAEDEVDMEYEQLKELEAEQGLDKEDFEALYGAYTSLEEGFIGRRQLPYYERAVHSEYLKYVDMWKIPTRYRGATYTVLQMRAKEIIRERFRELLTEYNTAAHHLKVGKWERDGKILQSAKIVGMTTTGLSKYRALVSSIKPRVILIEEAAQVIEAPLAVACIESLQHLILVGDHQQLQGQCAVRELEGEPFHLNVSMFERLVHNGIDFKRLTSQRRMAPEIRRVLNPIYSDLEDHATVLNRPGVPGMGGVNSFFFCHCWPESSDSLLSKYNDDEARMVVGFYLYLYLNGVPLEQITILTFYNGQRKKILKALRDNPLFLGQYVKVVTVDSYQGEENEIVLLSLVRSSESGSIGFLGIENRVCVALSRAKRGFYIFGNAESLSVANSLWWEVAKVMKSNPKRLGYHLPLACTKHGNKTFVKDPAKWGMTDGGCSLKCEEKLECGHQCPLRCHTIDHSQVRCKRKCPRQLPCGHACGGACCEGCRCTAAECNGVEEKRLVVQNRVPSARVTPPSMQQSRWPTPAEHAALVERYHDYANGGVEEADARLAVAASDLATQNYLSRADHEAYQSLFGSSSDDNTNNEPAVTAPQPPETMQVNGDGMRRRYVQYYTSDPAPSRPANAGGKQPNPLESLI
ncbi:hypothetical protein AJ80_05096 [Polytolypa hystricis UAMH7299]|uniref:Helicase ATP-binding domain-containing protein n=1 Tax=Polytolypa hystricis (strain UAMH7299) TaxID=1447883 RepID=A0A2B7Y6V4_POLH7|nr:hypothetical protein AJ80_05096 [Polytolypa hystricis UAMH7299]